MLCEWTDCGYHVLRVESLLRLHYAGVHKHKGARHSHDRRRNGEIGLSGYRKPDLLENMQKISPVGQKSKSKNEKRAADLPKHMTPILPITYVASHCGQPSV